MDSVNALRVMSFFIYLVGVLYEDNAQGVSVPFVSLLLSRVWFLWDYMVVLFRACPLCSTTVHGFLVYTEKEREADEMLIYQFRFLGRTHFSLCLSLSVPVGEATLSYHVEE